MKTSIHVVWITGCIYVAAMVHDAKGAENPCEKVWQWQWKTPPKLEIEAPQDVPDGCVGQITVGPAVVTATAGVKWEVDINNCPEPPHTRNETVVPITPVNTWDLYLWPAGTTPKNGSGTTAEFTTIHGGEVVVQFKSEASVANPPWQDQVADRTIPFGVGPEIIQPDNDPETVDNHYVFSYTSGEPWPDGRCDITPLAVCGCSAEKWLEWDYPDIGGCLKMVHNGQWPYHEPVLSYLRMPAANAYFGEKTVTVTRQPDECAHEVTVELFFSSANDAVNHPGSQSGVTPNWFFYWKHTSAKGNPAYPPTYAPSLGQPGFTDYVNGSWHPYMGPEAKLPPWTTPEETPRHEDYFDGIDGFAYTWRHEARHASVLNFWFPDGGGGPNDEVDLDNDDLPDSLEPTLGASEGGPYDPNVQKTYGNLHDGHRYVYFTQNDWTIGHADHQDWSAPGHQSEE